MSYTQLSESRHVARKKHVCMWCGQHINAGEQYIRLSGVYDGDFQVNKFHPECDEACTQEAAYEGPGFEFWPHENERPYRAAKEGRDD